MKAPGYGEIPQGSLIPGQSPLLPRPGVLGWRAKPLRLAHSSRRLSWALGEALPAGCGPPGSPCSGLVVFPVRRFPFLPFRYSRPKWISKAPCRIKQPGAKLRRAPPGGLACLLPADLLCRAVLCRAGAGPGQQAWMLPGVSAQWWARREIAPAKVASSRGSRNNTCKQEVISRGKRFNGSVTWHCTKTQPRAAAASSGGCRARRDAWEAVPCQGRPRRSRCVRSRGRLRRGLP